MTDNIRRLFNAIARSGDGRYQVAQATGVLSVASVERDSTGAIVSAIGTLDGAGEFTVPLKGHQAAPGDYVLVGFPSNQPVGAELAYLRHVASDYPGAGIIAIDGTVPAPTFAAVPWTTGIVKLPGSITAKASVFFVAVEARYQPSGYTVSYRIDGGEWRDRAVPHVGGVQECDLGSDLPPSASVDVHLRARYQWNASESVPTADSTFATADDDSSPGDVIGIAVEVGTPGVLGVTLTAVVDTDLLLGYRYELARGATAAPDQRSAPLPARASLHVLPGQWYVAAYPVSKAGVAGGRFPATGYQGPYTVADYGEILDTVPPPAPSPPDLSAIVLRHSDGTTAALLRLTLDPNYPAPPDLRRWVLRLQEATTGALLEFPIEVS